MDALIGPLDTWLLVIGVAVLAGLLLMATLVALTYATRGTPLRRVRAIDSGVAQGADRSGAQRRAPGERPVALVGAEGGGGGRGSVRAGRSSDQEVDGISPLPVESSDFCEVAKVLCKTALAEGHRVECHVTGDALFEVLLDELAAARELVTWHVFWYKPGALAERVAEVLMERARAGVRVLMLFDHYGSKGLPDEYRERLRGAGVEVARFRLPRWNTLYKAQHRMHIRAVVIDGRVGYTGGFGIDDRWRGDGRHSGQWRDTSVRVEGAAVSQLQGAFAANWGEATGELLLGDRVFRFDDQQPGTVTAGLLYSSPSLGSTSAERFFVTAIAAARERLWLTTAYFVPNREFRRLLCEASERGVDVRVLTPGANTDQRSTWYAARAHEAELLEHGVRLFEYRPTMLHAKTLVVDGIWGMVGTLNFDNRSMVLNDEVALVFWDRGIGQELEEAFEADLAWADELTREQARRRDRGLDRVRARLASRVSRLL